MQDKFLIITGMSGAGKTQVMHTLEDLDYFCIDNLPATLIPKFAELCRQSSEEKVALVVDVRGERFFDKFAQVLEEMAASGTKYELLFLDASDETLVRRYKETRRRHPLGARGTLLDNIHRERELLKPISSKATKYLDTSVLPVADLRKKISELFGSGKEADRMGIVVRSFGFKHGIPLDSDMVMDVRFLPNPFYVEELRKQTGLDKPVAEYIAKFPQTYEYLKREMELLDFLIPQYINEGKAQLVISVGCTGGQHRSVYIANKVYEYLTAHGYKVSISHRDMAMSK